MQILFIYSAVRKMSPWALTLLASVTAAQTPAESTKVMPPTKLQYTSSLSAYQGYADEPVQSWREANDRVERIGGWKAYAKESKANKP